MNLNTFIIATGHCEQNANYTMTIPFKFQNEPR